MNREVVFINNFDKYIETLSKEDWKDIAEDINSIKIELDNIIESNFNLLSKYQAEIENVKNEFIENVVKELDDSNGWTINAMNIKSFNKKITDELSKHQEREKNILGKCLVKVYTATMQEVFDAISIKYSEKIKNNEAEN